MVSLGEFKSEVSFEACWKPLKTENPSRQSYKVWFEALNIVQPLGLGLNQEESGCKLHCTKPMENTAFASLYPLFLYIPLSILLFIIAYIFHLHSLS